ncbi:MAG: hypothetical protein AMXMBFR19_15660 [Chthonomonadaceae bacterium]|uniref:Uncharacterized protein n=1 Tax=Candidatus Nitrosymbiomonas proteolyticus TaxID=2608984 RepID=A0A809RDQ6_9BACT|nr:hypothetical protein NPRO_01200 [Candidatus Nitrosymbiomonas proteolyticus]
MVARPGYVFEKNRLSNEVLDRIETVSVGRQEQALHRSTDAQHRSKHPGPRAETTPNDRADLQVPEVLRHLALEPTQVVLTPEKTDRNRTLLMPGHSLRKGLEIVSAIGVVARTHRRELRFEKPTGSMAA